MFIDVISEMVKKGVNACTFEKETFYSIFPKPLLSHIINLPQSMQFLFHTLWKILNDPPKSLNWIKEIKIIFQDIILPQFDEIPIFETRNNEYFYVYQYLAIYFLTLSSDSVLGRDSDSPAFFRFLASYCIIGQLGYLRSLNYKLSASEELDTSIKQVPAWVIIKLKKISLNCLMTDICSQELLTLLKAAQNALSGIEFVNRARN